MYAAFEKNLKGACGTFTVHVFSDTSHNPGWCGWNEVTKENLEKFSGIGVFYAGFQKGQKLSDDMFELLSSIATPVYVSPVRRNPNSNTKEFFFAVFELQDKLNKEST